MGQKNCDILQNIHYDMLTELPDNLTFYDCINAITKQDEAFDIMILSIEDFKHFNDLFSYSFGNKILVDFAQEIKNILPENAELFRLDGNGFGVLSPTANDSILNLYQEIKKLAHKTHIIEGMNISFDISAGVCQYPKDGTDNDILYRNARIALSYAKDRAQNQCILYQNEMAEKAKRDLLILEDMRYSVEHDFVGFSMVYQPIIHAHTKDLFGCEALLRYTSAVFPEGISPFVFVPLLENSGLILDVGKWVIDTAFEQCAKWCKIIPNFQMNVNVSARQFDEEDFPDYVMNSLFVHRLDPQAITLELTESEPAQFEFVNKAFHILRKQGIKTAFDDFGTGYASLDIFRSISGDELKVDRSFLEHITYDITDQVLLKSITSMCSAMKITSCIEGIETPEMENIVVQMNPDLLQGYLYSRPISPQKFEEKYLSSITQIQKQDNQQNANRSALAYTELRPAKPMPMSAIVDNAYAAIIQVGMDDNFTLLSCNEGYRRMLGYTAKEIEEKYANQALGFVHPDDIEWVNAEVRRQLGMGDTLHSEFRIMCKDGTSLWVFGSGNVAYSQDGNPSLIVVIMNIDEEKNASLKELENAKFASLLTNHLPNGIICTNDNQDLDITYVSSSFLSLTGYTKDELKKNFSNQLKQLIYEDDYNQFNKDMILQKTQPEYMNLFFRIYCKDNSLIQIETLVSQMTDDHSQQLCFSIINASEETIASHNENRGIQMKQLYKKTDRKMDDVVFEYNSQSNSAKVSQNFETMFGFTLPEDNIIHFDAILGEDSDKFYDALEIARMGGHCDSIEIRMICSNLSEIWCKVSLHTNDNIQHRESIIFGKITNIDNEHHEQEINKEISQLDKLTRLLNKAALETRITSLLKNLPDEKFALFLLDLNNFTEINDKYGHFIGDIVLKTISLRLRNLFRDSDIIGRVGGDEFMVMMKYSGDIHVLEERCQRLSEYICSPIKIKNYEPFHISAGIGVSIRHSQDTTFAQIFNLADQAMYRVKKSDQLNYFISE